MILIINLYEDTARGESRRLDFGSDVPSSPILKRLGFHGKRAKAPLALRIALINSGCPLPPRLPRRKVSTQTFSRFDGG